MNLFASATMRLLIAISAFPRLLARLKLPMQLPSILAMVFSENANFAEQVEKSGFIFVGPRAESIRQMGDKYQRLKRCEIRYSLCTRIRWPDWHSDAESLAIAKNRLPHLSSIWCGGVVNARSTHRITLTKCYCDDSTEARSAFNNEWCTWKYLENPRHIEIKS